MTKWGHYKINLIQAQNASGIVDFVVGEMGASWRTGQDDESALV